MQGLTGRTPESLIKAPEVQSMSLLVPSWGPGAQIMPVSLPGSIRHSGCATSASQHARNFFANSPAFSIQ